MKTIGIIMLLLAITVFPAIAEDQLVLDGNVTFHTDHTMKFFQPSTSIVIGNGKI